MTLHGLMIAAFIFILCDLSVSMVKNYAEQSQLRWRARLQCARKGIF
jgi:hypothetical protein